MASSSRFSEGLGVDAAERRRRGIGRVFRTIWRRVGYTRSGRVGTIILLLIIGIALFGPFLAPHSIIDIVGLPFVQPSPHALLGTDFLGRDVLSRFLNGGRVLLLVAFLSTGVAYICGGLVGLLAGYRRGPAGGRGGWGGGGVLSVPAGVRAPARISA